MNLPTLRFKRANRQDFPDWELRDLKQIANRVITKNRALLVKHVLTNSATQGIVSQSEYFDRDIANKNNLDGYYVVELNDFVYNPRISVTAPVGPIKRNKLAKGVMSPLYTVFRFKEGHLSYLDYLEQYFETKCWHEYLKSVANSGARHDRMNISNNDFLSLPIMIPAEEEQKKIAKFLTAVDEKISQLTQIYDLLALFKNGAVQQICSQKLRFKDGGQDFPAWQEKTIGDVFKERSERDCAGAELLSVTINEGVKKRSEIDSKDNSSNDKSNYKKVLKGDIVYNSMRMWQGASGVSHYDGIVSPAYTVLKANPNHNSLFFAYLFKSKQMIQVFQKYSQGLTSDTWNLKYPELSKIPLTYPSLKEQEKIANFLRAIDDKLMHTQAQLDAAKQYKQGLLQQMFV